MLRHDVLKLLRVLFQIPEDGFLLLNVLVAAVEDHPLVMQFREGKAALIFAFSGQQRQQTVVNRR